MDIKTYLIQIEKVISKGRYKDNWDSLCSHPVPKWYKDGKFGLFIHWGVYSVPAYESEWYPRLMHIKGTRSYFHHIKKYGGVDKFPYENFIPMFTAPKFNAREWVSLFKKSGAKYIMPVGEHHDGIKMYQSDLSPWNTLEVGPKKDIISELHTACDEAGIGLLTSNHRAEHFWFMNGGQLLDCPIKRGENKSLYGEAYLPSNNNPNSFDTLIVPSEEWMEDWLASAAEMIDKNQPLAVYFDWWVMHKEFRPYMKKFLAYYYNRGLEWGKEVTVFYKWDSIMKGAAVFDVERGQLDGIQPFVWQNDTAIAKNSWGYTEGNDFKKPFDIVCNLIDVVSKNGCFMLNVGPKADGTICDEEKAVLCAIGDWLISNGEGIYGTEPFRVYGESKTKVKNGSFKENFKYTDKDLRFTYKPNFLYVFALGFNKKNTYLIKSLAFSNDKMKYEIKNVSILGKSNKVSFEHNNKMLKLIINGSISKDMPICFKIEIV